MSHTIQIPDPLWDRWGGSPMAMRDSLWEHAPNGDKQQLGQRLEDLGTWFELKWGRPCSRDGEMMDAGQRVLVRTGADGQREYLCEKHGGQLELTT